MCISDCDWNLYKHTYKHIANIIKGLRTLKVFTKIRKWFIINERIYSQQINIC